MRLMIGDAIVPIMTSQYWSLPAPFYCEEETREMDSTDHDDFDFRPSDAVLGLAGSNSAFTSVAGSTDVTIFMAPGPREAELQITFKASGATVITIEAFAPDDDTPIDSTTVRDLKPCTLIAHHSTSGVYRGRIAI